MHLRKRLVLVLFFVFLTAGCGAKKARVQPAPSGSRATTAVAVNVPANETPVERLHRLRVEKVAADMKLAEAVKEALKNASPAEKKVEKLEKEEAKVWAHASVTGCEGASVPVVVDARAVEYTTWLPMATVDITNVSQEAVNISTAARGIGVAVHNLCSGGSVKLFFALRVDTQSEEIILKASTSSLGAGTLTDSIRLYLNRYQTRYKMVEPRDWNIQLRRY